MTECSGSSHRIPDSVRPLSSSSFLSVSYESTYIPTSCCCCCCSITKSFLFLADFYLFIPICLVSRGIHIKASQEYSSWRHAHTTHTQRPWNNHVRCRGLISIGRVSSCATCTSNQRPSLLFSKFLALIKLGGQKKNSIAKHTGHVGRTWTAFALYVFQWGRLNQKMRWPSAFAASCSRLKIVTRFQSVPRLPLFFPEKLVVVRKKFQA